MGRVRTTPLAGLRYLVFRGDDPIRSNAALNPKFKRHRYAVPVPRDLAFGRSRPLSVLLRSDVHAHKSVRLLLAHFRDQALVVSHCGGGGVIFPVPNDQFSAAFFEGIEIWVERASRFSAVSPAKFRGAANPSERE
jgi:hypothetical protein